MPPFPDSVLKVRFSCLLIVWDTGRRMHPMRNDPIVIESVYPLPERRESASERVSRALSVLWIVVKMASEAAGVASTIWWLASQVAQLL